jgi:glycerol kinase
LAVFHLPAASLLHTACRSLKKIRTNFSKEIACYAPIHSILDQGTTSSRAIIFDKKGTLVSSAQKEFTQIFPQPGWVEHDAAEIWSTQIGVATEAYSKSRVNHT